MQSLESLGSDGVWSGILGICQGCGVWGAACAGSKIPEIRVPMIQGCGLQGAACAECCGAGLWLFPVPRPGYPLVLLWGSHSGNSLPAAPTAAMARAGAGTAPGQVQPGWRRDFFISFALFHTAGTPQALLWVCTRGWCSPGILLDWHTGSWNRSLLTLRGDSLSLQQGCDPCEQTVCSLQTPEPDCGEIFYKEFKSGFS